MDIRDQIRQACLGFLADNGMYPNAIYLGMDQCCELDQIIADRPGAFHVSVSAFCPAEDRRQAWTVLFGTVSIRLTVYCVNAYSHLQVGQVR